MKPLAYVFLVLFLCGAWFSATPTAYAIAGIKTDLGVYLAPPPPVFSGAGSVIIDPTFGTSIMKITDVNDGVECSNNYSYWSSFNKDSTWLMVGCYQPPNPATIFYKWDPVNFAITQKIVKPLEQTPFYLDLAQGIWSALDPNVLFVQKYAFGLYSYNVATDKATVFKDFRTMFPGEYQWQFSRSINDDIFAFTRKSESNYGTVGYAVWKRSTDKIIYKVDSTSIDEVQIDKTGRYLVVKFGRPDQSGIETQIVDLQSGVVTNLKDGAPDYSFGHSDNGSGFQVGEEDWQGKIWKYDLANPSIKTDLIGASSFSWNTGGGHYSMLADDESWVLASTIGGTGVLGREIYMLATDGSLRIKRIAHHQSIFYNYRDVAKPDISRDGKFVAFTSNWGATSAGARTDVYVVSTSVRTNPDTTAPVLSSVISTNVTSSGATLTWVSDESSNTQVEYGLTTAYGSVSSLNPSLSTAHTVVLSSLSPNTTYNYRVKSTDASGNLAVSANGTFTTLSNVVVDTTAPSVPTSLVATAISSSQINLSWLASGDAVGVVGYKIFRNGTQVDTSNTNSYSSAGLSASTLYSFTVSAYDLAGNNSVQSSSVNISTQSLPIVDTPPPPPEETEPPVVEVTPTPVPTPIVVRPNATSTRKIHIKKNLSRSMTDSDVALLQTHLKEIGLLDSSIETSLYFGSYTESAVKQYQISNNIEPTGTVGPITRASLAGTAVEATVAPTSSSVSENQSFPITLSLGMQHPDVSRLQNILKRLGFFPVTVSSSGSFGPTTKKAVQAFQRTYNIVSGGTESTTGYGMVGKATWTKLLSL